MSVEWFVTEAGVRVPAITAEQMRRVDEVAVSGAGPNLFQMMENAGRSLALTVMDGLRARRGPVVVLAGTGGNGGGGICAARHMANRDIEVSVVVSDVDRLGEVPAAQLEIFRGTAGRVATVAELDSLESVVIVDAVIGYSLGGAPRGLAGEMIDWANRTPVPVIALDVPSGVDATTGETPGISIEAGVTLTLALPKTGLGSVGDLWLADLGIPAEVYRRVGIDVAPDTFAAGYRVRLRQR